VTGPSSILSDSLYVKTSKIRMYQKPALKSHKIVIYLYTKYNCKTKQETRVQNGISINNFYAFPTGMTFNGICEGPFLSLFRYGLDTTLPRTSKSSSE